MTDQSNLKEKLTPLQSAVLAMKKMREKLDELERSQNEPIAIVGMGCRFPGGSDTPEKFWDFLKNGRDGVIEIPENRQHIRVREDRHLPLSERKDIQWAACIEDVERFDSLFFDISPREAICVDPRQRILLEVCWEALERAGQVPEQFVGSSTGVFIGMTTNDYQQYMIVHRPKEVEDFYSFTGLGDCFLAGRVSYALGLQGPSLSINTACSSSLVSVHLACQSLRNDECSMALAGGVNLVLSPQMPFVFAGTPLLMSPDGRCNAFDSRANGIVRGEGCGIVVLKRLSDAEKDGDTILALIRSSVLNQDGHSAGLVAPNVLSQQSLIQRALKKANVETSQISYVETHGTGTSLGDPIEFEALKEVFNQPRKEDSRCVLGAVKTNIGHLEAAAGVAGLIKVVLAMQHEAIPPNIHFKKLNPRISLQGTPFVIPTERIPWKSGAEPRYACLSSFGASGTNAHAVLEEAPPRPAVPKEPPRPDRRFVLPLSGKTQGAVRDLAKSYQAFLIDERYKAVDLEDICYTAGVRRAHHNHRMAVVAHSKEETAERIETFLTGEPAPGVCVGQARSNHNVVFVFPGYGSQWLGMGRQLMEREPVFKSQMEACDQALRRYANWSLLNELAQEDPAPRLKQIAIMQPILVAFEIALAELWRSWEIQPSAVVGHSMGEVAAAYVAGAFSLSDAMKIIYHRSEFLARMEGKGAAGVVGLSLEQTQEVLKPYAGKLSVAVIASPHSTLVSGASDALNELLASLESEGIFVRRLELEIAVHSVQLEGLLPELKETLAGIQPKATTSISFCAAVTGEVMDGESLTPEYWARNFREPVRFYNAVKTLMESEYNTFVEMSPHPILVRPIQESFAHLKKQGLVVSSLRRDQDESEMMLDSLGTLYANGYSVDWQKFYPSGRFCIYSPTYAWQRQTFWFEDEGREKPVITSAQPEEESESKPKRGVLREKLLETDPTERKALLEKHICKAISHIVRLDISKLDSETPFKNLGIDSLMSLELKNQLEYDLGMALPITMLLKGPSLTQLSTFLISQLPRSGDVQADLSVSNMEEEEQFGVNVVKLQDEVALDPSITFEAPVVKVTEPQKIFLTGSTGFLGAFLLHELLKETQADIYCLVRCANPDEGKQRIQKNLKLYGLENEDLSRVIPVPGDLSKPLLGLSEEPFLALAEDMEALYHNGAAVNWIYPYSRLKAVNVFGTQEVLRLAAQTQLKPVHLISSIGVFPFFSGDFTRKILRESDSLDHGGILYGGYTQSKWVAEKVAMLARSKGLPLTIYRPGMIVGDTQSGAWNTDDFISQMIKTIIEFKDAPNLGSANIDLTPVDYVSQAVVYLSKQEESLGEVFHLAHPNPPPIDQVMSYILSYGFPLTLSPYNEWQKKLLEASKGPQKDSVSSIVTLFSMSSAIGGDDLPILPMLLSAMPEIDSQNTLNRLENTSIACPDIDSKLFERYLSYFVRSGFLKAPH